MGKMMLFEVMELIREIEPKILEKVMEKVNETDRLLLKKREEIAICESFRQEELEREYAKLYEKLEKWIEIENAMVDNVHPF